MSIVCINKFYVKGASHILGEKPRKKSITDSRCRLAQLPFPDLLSGGPKWKRLFDCSSSVVCSVVRSVVYSIVVVPLL